jgi:hypothetical protein
MAEKKSTGKKEPFGGKRAEPFGSKDKGDKKPASKDKSK